MVACCPRSIPVSRTRSGLTCGKSATRALDAGPGRCRSRGEGARRVFATTREAALCLKFLAHVPPELGRRHLRSPPPTSERAHHPNTRTTPALPPALVVRRRAVRGTPSLLSSRHYAEGQVRHPVGRGSSSVLSLAENEGVAQTLTSIYCPQHLMQLPPRAVLSSLCLSRRGPDPGRTSAGGSARTLRSSPALGRSATPYPP